MNLVGGSEGSERGYGGQERLRRGREKGDGSLPREAERKAGSGRAADFHLR